MTLTATACATPTKWRNCPNASCRFRAAATDSDDSCTYVDGICETCENGIIVDNDTDGDGVCDADEIAGCQDAAAYRYNAAATDSDDSCALTWTASARRAKTASSSTTTRMAMGSATPTKLLPVARTLPHATTTQPRPF